MFFFLVTQPMLNSSEVGHSHSGHDHSGHDHSHGNSMRKPSVIGKENINNNNVIIAADSLTKVKFETDAGNLLLSPLWIMSIGRHLF